jgi:hypothetical protein
MVIRFAWRSHTMSIVHRNSHIKQGTAQVSSSVSFLLVGWLVLSFVRLFFRSMGAEDSIVRSGRTNKRNRKAKRKQTNEIKVTEPKLLQCTALYCTVLYCTDFGRTVRRVVLSAMGGGTYKWRTVVWVTDRHVCMKRSLPCDKFWQCHVWGRSGVHFPKS